MDNYTLEPSMRIYDDNNGACLEVRVHPDAPESIEIHAPNNISEKWYGNFSLGLNSTQAELLIKALRTQLDLMDDFDY